MNYPVDILDIIARHIERPEILEVFVEAHPQLKSHYEYFPAGAPTVILQDAVTSADNLGKCDLQHVMRYIDKVECSCLSIAGSARLNGNTKLIEELRKMGRLSRLPFNSATRRL